MHSLVAHHVSVQRTIASSSPYLAQLFYQEMKIKGKKKVLYCGSIELDDFNVGRVFD